MPIPESQLETWAKQGAVQQSKATYATVKNALEDPASHYAGRTYTSFLQGSYCNDTNVYAESDVDVVMRLDSTFYHDLQPLTETEKASFHHQYGNANYGLIDFKTDVTAWLTQKFGAGVKPGSKPIFIPGVGNRRDADVLVAAQYRRYRRFGGMYVQDYAEGICFHDKNGNLIENFPKQHSTNCTTKHQGTSHTAALKD